MSRMGLNLHSSCLSLLNFLSIPCLPQSGKLFKSDSTQCLELAVPQRARAAKGPRAPCARGRLWKQRASAATRPQDEAEAGGRPGAAASDRPRPPWPRSVRPRGAVQSGRAERRRGHPRPELLRADTKVASGRGGPRRSGACAGRSLGRAAGGAPWAGRARPQLGARSPAGPPGHRGAGTGGSRPRWTLAAARPGLSHPGLPATRPSAVIPLSSGFRKLQ